MGYPVTVDEQVLVSAVRHALGRKTYIVWDTCRAVRAAWQQMSHSARAVVARDITKALDTAEQNSTTVGMETDHREWASLLDEIRSGALLEPKVPATSDDEELGPDQGYPSEDELQRLAGFHGTARELVEYVESIWRNGAGVLVEHGQNHWGREEVYVTFITGGWSGCESIIGVLKRTLASTFAHSWTRGGSHTFAFPATRFNSDEAWDWALLPGAPATDPGPHTYIRDRLASLEAAVDERVHELEAQTADFRSPVPGDLWALREEHVDSEDVYYFSGSYYLPEKHTNPWAGEIEPSDERLTSGRLLFRDGS